jgi:sugar O-acyltransferase, sialic acid O-acetyltransferase NeuD family
LLKPVIIIGGGGHAAVILDILKQLKQPVAAIVSPEIDRLRQVFCDVAHLHRDEEILSYDCNEVELVNGIGSLPGNSLRVDIFKRFKERGYFFKSVVSPNAIVSPYAQLGEGVQVMANSVVQAGAVIGDNTVINTSATIEHDCIIGSHNHIAPGAVLCGSVETGDRVHIGVNASVIQSVHIGEGTVVGSGACLTKSIGKNNTVYPAKISIKKRIVSIK